jgi:hypothetical protein
VAGAKLQAINGGGGIPGPRVVAAVVDEFGRLDDELAGMKPKERRHEQLRKQIAGWFESADPAGTFVLEGRAYTVEVSPRSNERKILSMPKLMKRLGSTLFLKLCTFPLKVLDAHIPAAEQEPLVATTPTGSRKVTPAPKLLPAGEQAA